MIKRFEINYININYVKLDISDNDIIYLGNVLSYIQRYFFAFKNSKILLTIKNITLQLLLYNNFFVVKTTLSTWGRPLNTSH